MNRKILAVLLLCPVLVFAADRMISYSGKKPNPTVKEKISSSTGVANLKNGDSPATSNNTDIKKGPATELGYDDLVAEMKISISNREDRDAAYHETEYTGLWDDEKVNTELNKFLTSHVLNKLSRANVCRVDLKKSFSRCPSGYDVNVIVKDGKVTNEGWLVVENGCDYEPIARFRYDVASAKVDAQISAKAGYVALDDFLKIYKSATRNTKNL
jgi:hypothetical protein